jgi:DNA-directed RNA polymerase specialized sigma24 family protein
MREWLELETGEISQELAITSTNLWVLLHRARFRQQTDLMREAMKRWRPYSDGE